MSGLISFHGMACRIPTYDCISCLQSVSIACAFRWGVASVENSLLSVAHPVWDNISYAENALVDGSYAGLQG